MKKNITINMFGRLYSIDEDAYELLKKYTESIHQTFDRQEGGEEIANDLEARIAELFDELKAGGVDAITIEHVQDIIARIGNPEQMSDDTSRTTGSQQEEHFRESASGGGFGLNQTTWESYSENLKKKKLFRDPTNKVLAGVLSGLANYFGGDPTFWRLGFILLVFGSGSFFSWNYFGWRFSFGWAIIAYIVLAVIVPEAKTPEDRLKMKGKEVNPQNLGDEVSAAVQQPQETKTNGASGCLSGGFKVLGMMLKIFVFLLGVCLFVPFLVLLSGMAAMFFSPEFVLGNMFYPDVAEVYHQNMEIFWTLGGCLLVGLFIPAYAAIHAFLSTAGKQKPMGTTQRVFWLCFWLIAVVGIVASAVKMGEVVDKYENEVRQQRRIEAREKDLAEMYQEWDEWYFKEHRFTLCENTEEGLLYHTMSGEYPALDKPNRKVINNMMRYLDAWKDGEDVLYQAERQDTVDAGNYRLTCIARASEESEFVCIYAIAGTDTLRAFVEAVGNEGGQLWEDAKKSEVAGKATNYEKNVVEGNNGKGYGWSVVTIPNIKVGKDGIVRYGISTDPQFTGQPTHCHWFSATDFKLERM